MDCQTADPDHRGMHLSCVMDVPAQIPGPIELFVLKPFSPELAELRNALFRLNPYKPVRIAGKGVYRLRHSKTGQLSSAIFDSSQEAESFANEFWIKISAR